MTQVASPTHGVVQVENGSTTVKHVWTLNLTSVSGSFAAGDAVTWGVDGVGSVTSWIGGGTNRLRLVKTSGSDPAVGDTVEKSGGGPPSGDISSFGQGSPPSFNTLSAGDVFIAQNGVGTRYDVTSPITAGALALTGPYGETDEDELEFVVHRDFDAQITDVPLIVEGDRAVKPLISRAIGAIIRELFRASHTEQPIAINASAQTEEIDWRLGRAAALPPLEESIEVRFLSPPRGPGFLYLRIPQDSTGGWNVTTWPVEVLGAPTLEGTADTQELLGLYWTGSVYIAHSIWSAKPLS